MEFLNNPDFSPPGSWLKFETIDLYTLGEPLRIITKGLPVLKGSTVLEKRKYFRENHDSIRKSLIWEPRGHKDMYGAVITKAHDPANDFGVFFCTMRAIAPCAGMPLLPLQYSCISQVCMILQRKRN